MIRLASRAQRKGALPWTSTAKGIVTRKGRDSRPPRCGNQKREARGAAASRARSAPPRGFAQATRLRERNYG